MTQATDLGNIGNQLAAVYRTRVNANIQALATQHYGAGEPSPLYPNMIWLALFSKAMHWDRLPLPPSVPYQLL